MVEASRCKGLDCAPEEVIEQFIDEMNVKFTAMHSKYYQENYGEESIID